jgi:hypothetical protein
MAHTSSMTTTAPTRPWAARRPDAVPVGIALIVAELLLAVLWFPWFVEHVALRSDLPFGVLRLPIVAPEYLLLALAVSLVGLTHDRRVAAVCCALLAGLLTWGVSLLVPHLASTPADLARHRDLLDLLDTAALVVVPLLGALAWALARRHGFLGLLATPVASLLTYWIQHSQWPLTLRTHLSFRGSEAVGMSLVILPVLLAVLAGWAAEQVQAARSATV